MRQHTLSHHPAALPTIDRTAAARLLHFVIDRYLLLPIGALIAFAWANLAAESYFRFAHALSFPVNEIAMAFFLALVVQEVLESMMPGGALHNWRRSAMPIIAAAGGIAGAAAVYVIYVHVEDEVVLTMGWPVACAIDVAAAYYVLKIFWPRSPALPFVLLLSLATDAFGLLVVALRPPVPALHTGAVLLMASAVGVAALLRWFNVRSFWPYIVFSGSLAWFALYWQDIHPALALIPIVPFLPREPRSLDMFADASDNDEVHHFEHEWNELVQLVLLAFGLVNAGVTLKSYDTGSWAILTASLVGRPLGILAAVGLALALGFHLPRRIGLREVVVIALATSSGFTFSLFVAAGMIPIGPVLAQVKFGALATVVGALATIGVARVLSVGTFARGRQRGRARDRA
jgi:NhaA family Na+:H+ antiporter